MARTRQVKPAFFMDEDIAILEPLARLLLLGLKTIADREGRLLDKPRTIKAHCLPHDNVDIEYLLNVLAEAGLISRYAVDDVKAIEIAGFIEDQNPHPKEAKSDIPGREKKRPKPWLVRVETRRSRDCSRRKERGSEGKRGGRKRPRARDPSAGALPGVARGS